MGKQIWQPIDPRNFGCDVSVHPPVHTDSGGGGGESQDNPTGGGECHLFLAGNLNRALLLGNRLFPWQKIACPSSLLKKRLH